MKAVRATLEEGRICLEEPLPHYPGRRAALLILDVEENDPPREGVTPTPATAEEEFEAIGLRDFFGDPVDGSIAWEQYFTTS